MVDLTGKRFGKLTVIETAGNANGRFKNGKFQKGEKLWLCKCDCGNRAIVRGTLLRSGNTTSCGCYRKERIKECGGYHSVNDLSRTRLYRILDGMKRRCNNINHRAYKRYGGRGIYVASEWLGADGFLRFYKWSMENGYSENLTIDRIDNEGGYTPDNCRWVSYKTQANNTRRNVVVELNGEKKTLTQWCEELHMNYNTISNRIHCLGMSAEQALTTPVLKRGQTFKHLK